MAAVPEVIGNPLFFELKQEMKQSHNRRIEKKYIYEREREIERERERER